MLHLSFGVYRRALTSYDSTLAYAVLGLIGGVASGLLVLAFEGAIHLLTSLWGGGATDFEHLPELQRFALPALSGLALGLAFTLLAPEQRETGIVHVISRLHSHYGALPFRNALTQFLAATVALGCGHSGGREGPGVHLGAAVTSLLGQTLRLPNNSLRILISCGTAGGIAAAFHTPLAGVIFAMEVIAGEYSVAGFLPVMLSAVAASAVSSGFRPLVQGFELGAMPAPVLADLPWVLCLGLLCGAMVALYVRITTLTTRVNQWPVALRFTMAGLLTGAVALAVPEVLGIGYDTLGLALAGDLAIATLLLVAGAKLITTAIGAGLGLPIGIIGPILLLGACLGGAMPGVVALLPDTAGLHASFYATLGMAAAMGAAFGAPLAASLAVIELTGSTGVAMPALLAIVTASLTRASLFRQRPAHQSVLRQLRRNISRDPVNQMLQSTDVSTVMQRSVQRLPVRLDPGVRERLEATAPQWCLVAREGEDLFLLAGDDLRHWLREHPGLAAGQAIELTDLGLRRWTLAAIPEQATLRQAVDAMRTQTAEAVCVYGNLRLGRRRVLGVITREAIEQATLAALQT